MDKVIRFGFAAGHCSSLAGPGEVGGSERVLQSKMQPLNGAVSSSNSHLLNPGPITLIRQLVGNSPGQIFFFCSPHPGLNDIHLIGYSPKVLKGLCWGTREKKPGLRAFVMMTSNSSSKSFLQRGKKKKKKNTA